MRTKLPGAIAAVGAALGLLAGSPGAASDGGEPATAVAVHATTVGRRPLERRLTAFGEIVPEPAIAGRQAAAARLSSATGGLVVAVRAVEEQAVARGAIVVQLDGRQADAAVERSRAALSQAEAEAQRQQRLSEHDDSSARQRELAERQLAEARAALAEAQAARDLLDVRAPLGGTVLRVDVRPGEVVGAGQALVEIVDLDRLTAEVRIPAPELPRVRLGQSAVVQVAGRDLAGRVVHVGSRVDPASGSAAARIAIASARGLHPGDFVRARIVVETHPEALAVPVSAVVYGADGGGSVAVLEGDRARLRPVRLGIEDGGWVEIDGDGIREGTRIVTREAYGLPDDTPVRAVEEPAAP